ncbi:MAG: SusE domain-containing protein [Bacteroidales bacterium]|nr:SusE domain-containing protein [Bacteroidales bacterium]MDD4383779.1 SusE domain-containing protein [Bacteroidales bacterium]MDY0198348.1 SusE domain-containing protein [Tenuifilaceae bacterium]
MNRFIVILLSIFVFAGCTDDTDDFDILGEAISDFTLQSPSNNSLLVLNSGATLTEATFNWEASKPGISKSITYILEFYLNEETLTEPIFTLPSENIGLDTKVTLTHQQIENFLETSGIAAGQIVNLKWLVKATNGDIIKNSPIYNISIKRFAEGLSPFSLISPQNQWVITLDTTFFPEPEFKNQEFKWEPITVTQSTNLPEVAVLFDIENGTFTNPIYSFDAVQGESSVSIPKKEIFTQIAEEGYSLNAIKWTVRASIGDLMIMAPSQRVIIDTTKYESLFLFGSSTMFGPDAINGYPMYKCGSTMIFAANTYLTEGNIFFSLIQNEGLTLGVNETSNLLEIGAPSAPNIDPNKMNLISANLTTKVVTVVPTILGLIGPATGSSATQTNLTEIAPYIWQGNVNLIGEKLFYIRLNNSWDYTYSQIDGNIRFGRTNNDQFSTAGMPTGVYTVTVNLTHNNYSYSIVPYIP